MLLRSAQQSLRHARRQLAASKLERGNAARYLGTVATRAAGSPAGLCGAFALGWSAAPSAHGAEQAPAGRQQRAPHALKHQAALAGAAFLKLLLPTLRQHAEDSSHKDTYTPSADTQPHGPDVD